MSIEFNFVDAGNGDAIFIFLSEGINIMIDGGEKYQYIRKEIEQIKSRCQYIDLLILTHIDDDHIRGFLDWLKIDREAKNLIKEIWFNSLHEYNEFYLGRNLKNSIKQGLQFEGLVRELSLINKNFKYRSYLSTETGVIKFTPDLEILILSPTDEKLERLNKEYKKAARKITNSRKQSDHSLKAVDLIDNVFEPDTSPTNGSSIAIQLTYKKNINCLLLGDAHIDTVTKSLKKNQGNSTPLQMDFIKLSHHGSKHNINEDFLSCIDSQKFIISTSGKKHKHPDKETLAKISHFYFTKGQGQDQVVEYVFNNLENKARIEKCFSEDKDSLSNMKFSVSNKLYLGG